MRSPVLFRTWESEINTWDSDVFNLRAEEDANLIKPACDRVSSWCLRMNVGNIEVKAAALNKTLSTLGDVFPARHDDSSASRLVMGKRLTLKLFRALFIKEDILGGAVEVARFK